MVFLAPKWSLKENFWCTETTQSIYFPYKHCYKQQKLARTLQLSVNARVKGKSVTSDFTLVTLDLLPLEESRYFLIRPRFVFKNICVIYKSDKCINICHSDSKPIEKIKIILGNKESSAELPCNIYIASLFGNILRAVERSTSKDQC